MTKDILSMVKRHSGCHVYKGSENLSGKVWLSHRCMSCPVETSNPTGQGSKKSEEPWPINKNNSSMTTWSRISNRDWMRILQPDPQLSESDVNDTH